MPKTKFQTVIFTLIMAFFMVYCMTAYSIAVNTGNLTYGIFAEALKEMWAEYVIVFFIVFFAVSKIAMKLAFRIVNPKEDKPIFVILAIQSFTVCCMVPTITLIATFLHNGFTAEWFPLWIKSFVISFPMAFFLQIFFIGPLVRLIFRMIFKEKKN